MWRIPTRARQEALPYLLQYWDLWGRYTQFAREGRMPDNCEIWSKRAPMLYAMEFDELIERGLDFGGAVRCDSVRFGYDRPRRERAPRRPHLTAWRGRCQ